MKGDLLKKLTSKNCDVDLVSLQDKKRMYDSAREMYFDVKTPGNKSTPDRTLINLLKSPAILASGISNTIFLPSDSDQIGYRLKILLQQKQTGNISNIINDERVAIADKLLKYKCISKKQHEQILIKCNILHK